MKTVYLVTALAVIAAPVTWLYVYRMRKGLSTSLILLAFATMALITSSVLCWVVTQGQSHKPAFYITGCTISWILLVKGDFIGAYRKWRSRNDTQTGLAILEETMEYYSADTSRRGLENGSCAYINNKGAMCAVGRCMINPMPHFSGSVFTVENLAGKIDTLLKPQYRGHSLEFWSDLQGFHDFSRYWLSSKGMTDAGKLQYQHLVEKYSSQ